MGPCLFPIFQSSSPWEIFDASDFMVRSECGQWSPLGRFIYEWSNLLIMFAYLAIPVALVMAFYSVRHLTEESEGTQARRRLPLMSNMDAKISLWLYALFIFCCGIGHLLDGKLSFYWPAYRLFALWHLLTAMVSNLAALWTFYRGAHIIGYFFIHEHPPQSD